MVRLFWEDAGIAYDDIRYSFEEYPEYKGTKITELNPTGKIPVVELDGKILTQSYPMLRHFARLMGKYDGQNEDEKYLADVICDIVIDCMSPLPLTRPTNWQRGLTLMVQGVHSSSAPS